MDNNNKKNVHQINLILTNNSSSSLNVFEKKNDLKQNTNKLNLDSYEKSLIDNILLSKNDDFLSINNNKKKNNHDKPIKLDATATTTSNSNKNNVNNTNINNINNISNNYNNNINNNSYFIAPYWCNDELVPLVYKQVFDASRISNCDEINTELLYPILLLSSNIDRSLLGKIWGLVNRTLPGRLVKHELYMALALIALAQNNIDISNIDILNQLNTIPIPTFQIQIGNNNNLEYNSDQNVDLNNQLFTKNFELSNNANIPTSIQTTTSIFTNNNYNSNNNESNSATTIISNFANFDSFPILDNTENDASCLNENKNDATNSSIENNMNKIDDKYSYFTNIDQDYSQNRIEVWKKCLNSIYDITENVLLLVDEFYSKSDDNKNECKQIIKSNKGETFIKSFIEIYNLADRINTSINKYNVLNDDINNKIIEINKKFKIVCELLDYDDLAAGMSNKYSQNEYNGHDHDVNKLITCSLCLCSITNNDTLIISGSRSYHNTCINYWLNCVDQYNFPNLI